MKTKIKQPVLKGTFALIALFAVSLAAVPASPKGTDVPSPDQAATTLSPMDKKEKALAIKEAEAEKARAAAAERANAAAVEQLAPAPYKAPSVRSTSPRRLVPGTLSGTKNIPGDYPDLVSAIADLNVQGVGAGGVTLNLLAGNPQTAPAGGYVVGGAGSAVLTTTSAANQVLIEGNGNTITASGALTVGALNDAIFKLIGADYVTIDAFVMQENAANTVNTPAGSNNMTEWGVALLHVSTTDGCQNNTISNNTISLSRAYANTWGVYGNNRHSATAVTTTEDVTNNTTAPQSGNRVYTNLIGNVNQGIALIGSGTAANQDAGNDIGGSAAGTGNTLTNWGGAAALSGYVSNSATSYGIFVNHQVGDNVSFNTLTSAAVSGTSVTFVGIRKDFSTAAGIGTYTTNITNNTITMSSGFTSGTFQHILNQGQTALATATMNINNNLLVNSVVSGAASSSAMVGIANSSAPGTLSISNNTIRGFTSTATTGGFTGISSTGAVPALGSESINGNHIGDATAGAITFSAVNSGALTGITVSAPNASATLSINTNDFRGITYSNATVSTAANTYITWSHGASGGGNTVNNNTFTNLNLFTTGSVTFLSRGTGSSMTATGSFSVSNNSIVTGFNKGGAGGTVTGFTNGGGDSSVAGSAITHNGNNFSNVTLTGATAFVAWNDSNGSSSTSGPTKTITNNTFNNITTGAAQITGIVFNFSGNNTLVSSNTLSNLTGGGVILTLSAGTSNGGATETVSFNTFTNFTAGGQINALQTGFGAVTTGNINNNTITSLSTTAAAANPVFPIICSGFGTTTNIFKNKVCNVQSTGNALAGSVVFGILAQTAGTTYNISNNLVGDLRLPANGSANNLQGISIGTLTAAATVNLSYNTVWLNESTNAVAGFGSSALSASTTPTLVMLDNILVNTSVFNTTGLTVAYRRSSTALATYGGASNNNLFYAGTPGANNLIFTDGTNSFSLLGPGAGTYKDFVAPRDSNSVTGNPGFISTTCGDPTFLHISNASPAFHTGIPVVGITDDYDGDVRQPCTPDIGGDEVMSYAGPPIASVTITKTADSNQVVFGNQVGFVVKLTNTSANSALGLTVTDNLPAAAGVNWTIDAGASDAGWSVFGSPPTQSLQYSPSTLAGNATTQAHVISVTTAATCGATLNNTASFTITNGCTNSGSASASISVIGGGGLTTLVSQNFESGFGSWTTANNSTGGTTPAAVAWTIVTNPYAPGGSSTETLNSNSGTKFAISDSDLGGTGIVADTTLTSPSFNTVGYTSLTLAYRHYFRWISNTSLVEVSTDGGGTWTTVQSYGATQGAPAAFASASINLNAFVGNADVRVRFHYKAGFDWYWAIDDVVISGNAPVQACPAPPMVTGAVSTMTHGGAGTFNINLPQGGPVGIECRSGGATNDYTVVVTFDSSVTYSSVSVTSGTGSVSSVTGSGTNTLTVNLTGVTTAQVLTFTIFGASNGGSPADIPISAGVLVGDTTADGFVNSADISQTKSKSGQTVDGTNFRTDLNVDGSLNSADISLVKSKSGTALP